MDCDTNATFTLSIPYALRLIDRTNIYDANVFASHMQRELREKLVPVGINVAVHTSLDDTFTAELDLEPDDSEELRLVIQDAWDYAVDIVIINFWLRKP